MTPFRDKLLLSHCSICFVCENSYIQEVFYKVLALLGATGAVSQ